MKLILPLVFFLQLFSGFAGEILTIRGELSSCLVIGDNTILSLNSVAYELQSLEGQSKLQQAITKLYRQNEVLQINIPQSEILNQPQLLKSCLSENHPFSLAFPVLQTLKIQALVNPESLEISWLKWLETPVVLRDNQFLVFEVPVHFGSFPFSEPSLGAASEPLSPRAEPEAYPPGGTGYGSVTFDNGDSYTGYFKNYRFDGKGIYRWKNGNTHDGYWNGGQRHGSGTWIVVGLHRVVGNWVLDSLEGYGQTYYNNGQKYEGYFLNWLRHGQGKYSWPSGQYYEGSFLYGHFSGLGTMVLASGTKYVGNWVQSKRNGYGVETYPNGDSYSGSWANDRYHGQGKYIGNNWWYEGSWVEDFKDGLGTQETERSRYEGLWEKNQIHGRGKLTDKIEGTIWETSWIRGDLGGEYSGAITTRDGHRFEGVFKGLLPHQGKVIFSNQDSYEGPFVNGKFHGRGKYTFSQEGIVIEDEFKEDSCLLTLEETLARLNISMADNDSPPTPTTHKDGLFPEITAAFSAEDDSANGNRAAVAVVLIPFLKKVAATTTVGYMHIHSRLRFLTFFKKIAAVVVEYQTEPGTGIIYYREDERRFQSDLFLYVGRTINEANYECRKQVHNRVYKKLHQAHGQFKFETFETHIDIFNPIFKLKEQAYIEQCEIATHPLCAPHGPNHLANKIKGMGMRGFEEWKAKNPLDWALIETTCGLLP